MIGLNAKIKFSGRSEKAEGRSEKKKAEKTKTLAPN